MVSRIAFIFLLALTSQPAMAGELQFTGGASSTTYDDVAEANTWGLSVRLQYNFSVADSGWMINYYGPADSIFVGELASGYVWKSSGPLYFEGGVGAAFSRIWGIRPLGLVGVGYRITQTIFIDLPVMMTSNLTILPYIGMTF